MTKKAFKKALLCGRGECMRAVREEPERFRALVLWGCTHAFAYDAQSEGSRGWYFASLIAAYSDPTPFVETVEQAFMRTLVQDEWKFQHYTELLAALAEAALAAPDIKIQCTLLRQFGIYAPFPLSPLPLLPLARSSHEGLRTTVITQLSEATYPEIRRLALELAQETDREADAVLLLSRNFQPEDTGVLRELLRRLPTNQDNGWHGAYSAVLDMFGHGSLVRAPREFLSFLYENQRCSCCREDVLKQMSRRQMVSWELLEACRFDCNGDIRLWAEGKLNSFQK